MLIPTRANNGLNQKKEKKTQRKWKRGEEMNRKANSLMENSILYGNIRIFCEPREHIVLLRESTGSLTFLHVGDGVFAHHWRGKRDGDLHFWFLAWKNDDVGFLRVYLHLILIFRKGLPVKRTLCITTEETAGVNAGAFNLSLIFPVVNTTLKVLAG